MTADELRVAADSPWPVLIDIVEWIAARRGAPELLATLRLLCPEWGDIKDRLSNAFPGGDDVLESGEAGANTEFLINHLVRQISAACRSGRPIRLKLDSIGALAAADRAFVTRLRRLAATATVALSIEIGPKPEPGFDSPQSPVDPERAGAGSCTTVLSAEKLSLSDRLVASTGSGVPASLVTGPVDPILVASSVGPDGSAWLTIREGIRVDFDSPAAAALRAQALAQLWPRWPVEGWNYVRRLATMADSDAGWNPRRELFAQAFFAFGLAWPRDRFRAFVAGMLDSLADGGPVRHVAKDEVDQLRIVAGRLASGSRDEIEAAHRLAGSASAASDPVVATRMYWEAGNLLARQRTEPSLAEAAGILLKGLALARQTPEPRRSMFRAQLMNTMALVCYHRRRDRRALALERIADSIAIGSGDPNMRLWSDSVIRLNMARLLERRFGDADAALEQLAVTRASIGGAAQIRASLETARLLADRGAWDECFRILETVLQSGGVLSEPEDLWCRLLCFAAGTKLGHQARAAGHGREALRLAEDLGIAEVSRALAGFGVRAVEP